MGLELFLKVSTVSADLASEKGTFQDDTAAFSQTAEADGVLTKQKLNKKNIQHQNVSTYMKMALFKEKSSL